MMLSNEEIIQIAADTKTAEPGLNGYVLPISFAREVERAVLAKASQQVQGDRAMLLQLMEAFDTEFSVCEKCGHQEDTKEMDSAHFLREYLQAMPAPKQEPVGWVGTNSSGDKFLIAGEPDGRDWEYFKPFSVYDHPAPPQAAAIPEGWRLIKFDDLLRIVQCLPVDPENIPEGMQFSFSKEMANDALRMIQVAVKSMLSAAPKPEGE